MAKAHRHTRAARLVGRPADEKLTYEITDPAHTPDLHGEFAGGKVESSGGKQRVRLTAAQAQFYLDQGTLKLADEKAKPAAAEKK